MKKFVLFLTFLVLSFSLCSCNDNTTEVSALKADVLALLEDVSELKAQNEELKATIQSMNEQIQSLSQLVSLSIESSQNTSYDTTDVVPAANAPNNEPVNEDSNDFEALESSPPSFAPVQSDSPSTSTEPETSTSQNTVETYSEDTMTVFITASGSRYHYSSNCGSGTYFESTLEDAMAKGLTACKKCAGG